MTDKCARFTIWDQVCIECEPSPLKSCFLSVVTNDPKTNETKSVEEEKPISDRVNHPSHYCKGGIECIDAIRASMTPEEFYGYCKGNVEKYVYRWPDKNGIEDLKKAEVYLKWLIEAVEKNNNGNA